MKKLIAAFHDLAIACFFARAFALLLSVLFDSERENFLIAEEIILYTVLILPALCRPGRLNCSPPSYVTARGT